MKRRWPRRLLLFINIFLVIGLVLSFLSTYISPTSSSILPLFGLAYPIWLFGNLICLFLWIFVNRWMILLPAIPLVLGLSYLFDYWQFSPKREPVNYENTQLEIMSYNVRLFDLYNWTENSKTRNKIFAMIKNADPDVLCFQEFYKREVPGFFETRDTLVKFLKAKNVHEHYTHHLKNKQHFGLATFSFHPIVHRGEILFGNDPNNHCIYSDINTGDDTIRVYNVHFSSIRFQSGDDTFRKISRLTDAYKKRVSQSEMVLKHIRSSPYKVVICGDFNDTPISYCYRRFSEQLVDAFKKSGSGIGGTYVGLFPGLRIDYIFHDTSLNSYDFKTHDEEFSDHRAVTCTIEILKK